MNFLNILLMFPKQGGESGKGNFSMIFMFAAIFVILYFFMIRPQSKKAKEQRQFKEQIKKGDKVVTLGGIHGKIMEMKEKSIIIEIANNVKITIDREAISMESTRAKNAN